MQLFFYGVLIDALASPKIGSLLEGIGPGRPAAVRGTLYAVPDPRGYYPVLLAGDGEVRGMLHEAGSVDLGALDVFEGWNPAEPALSEYRRDAISVTGEGGQAAEAEVYFYNQATAPDFIPIEHGDFARWLEESGNRAFAG